MSVVQSVLVKIGADNKELHDALRESQGIAKNFGDAVGGLIGKGIVAGAAAASTAVLALAGAVKVGISEAMAMEEEVAQLDARLKSTAQSAGWTREEAIALANSLQTTTRFTDDQTLASQNLLLTFTRVGRDVFPDVIVAAQDMATAMKTDLLSATMMLGKAFQDPEEGLTALQRAGVRMTDSQKELIKSLMETGEVAQAQRMILTELQTEFGGAAKAAGGTLAGQLDILRNQGLNLLEVFGTKLIPVFQELTGKVATALKDPAIAAALDDLSTRVAKFASDSILNVQRFADYMTTLPATINAIQEPVVNVGMVIGSVFLAAKLLPFIEALIGLPATIGLAFGGIATLGEAVVALTLSFEALGVAAGSALLAMGPLAIVAAAILGAVVTAKSFAEYEATSSGGAYRRAEASTPESAAKAAIQADFAAWEQSTDKWTMTVDQIDAKMAEFAARMEALNKVVVADSWIQADDAYRASLELGEAAVSTFSDRLANNKIAESWIVAEDRIRTGGDEVGLALSDVARNALIAWEDYVIQKERSGPASTVEMLRRKGGSVGGLGYNLAPGYSYEHVSGISSLSGYRMPGDITGTKWAAAGGGAGGGINFPTSLATAFGGNYGAAQAWQAAFAQQHGGAQAGVTDVRDMMAGNLFQQKYGRAATEGEWQQRYYKGSFEGVDEGGLDATFGKPGTWATLVAEKAKQEAETQKPIIEAMNLVRTAADGTTTAVNNLADRLPGGAAPLTPEQIAAAAAAALKAKQQRENRNDVK